LSQFFIEAVTQSRLHLKKTTKITLYITQNTLFICCFFIYNHWIK